MPIPNLIHPVPIEIQKINRAGTLYDDDAREPIQFARRNATLIIPGQVKWASQFKLEQNRVGPVEGASGYVLFRQIDLDAADAGAGIELEQNDRFIKIGLRETDVYIIDLTPTGHYPDILGHTMLKAWFADRQPQKQKRGGF
jgi:hypothetical protein